MTSSMGKRRVIGQEAILAVVAHHEFTAPGQGGAPLESEVRKRTEGVHVDCTVVDHAAASNGEILAVVEI
jgi:hypothetical protein